MKDRLTGSEPFIGSFDARETPDGEDWCISIMLCDQDRIERWCSTWRHSACNGKTKVYQILREYGFNT